MANTGNTPERQPSNPSQDQGGARTDPNQQNRQSGMEERPLGKDGTPGDRQQRPSDSDGNDMDAEQGSGRQEKQ